MPEENNSPEQDMIFSSQDLPFKTEARARDAITKKGLDLNKYIVQSFEDGYVIVPKPPVPEEKYWWVTFNPKSNPSDPDDVMLSVNGTPKVFQRGVQTIVPDSYKEAADHATYPHYTQSNPNEERKKVGTIMVFPYSLHKEATKAEYEKLLKDGNKKTQKMLDDKGKLIS